VFAMRSSSTLVCGKSFSDSGTGTKGLRDSQTKPNVVSARKICPVLFPVRQWVSDENIVDSVFSEPFDGLLRTVDIFDGLLPTRLAKILRYIVVEFQYSRH
jgi:hypothetical protein